jgi:hypothetical protein
MSQIDCDPVLSYAIAIAIERAPVIEVARLCSSLSRNSVQRPNPGC